MNTKVLIELIGYLGSALVVVSMLMTSVVKLRIVNTVGSAIFMGYALVIGSYPTAVMNFFLIAINVWHLIRLLRDHKEYDLIETRLGDSFVSYFLEKNLQDIRTFFPDFSPEGLSGDAVFLICCSGQPASLFIGKSAAAGTLEIALDYAAPVYRDTSAGRYLCGQLKKRGFKTLVFRGDAPRHIPYMESIGYRRNAKDAYVLDLTKAD